MRQLYEAVVGDQTGKQVRAIFPDMLIVEGFKGAISGVVKTYQKGDDFAGTKPGFTIPFGPVVSGLVKKSESRMVEIVAKVINFYENLSNFIR